MADQSVVLYADIVRRLQQRLKLRGLLAGDPTGIYDKETIDAVREFQRAKRTYHISQNRYQTLTVFSHFALTVPFVTQFTPGISAFRVVASLRHFPSRGLCSVEQYRLFPFSPLFGYKERSLNE
ncbi:MAG: peptidoglycan-binding protein [Methylomicrobium sp.]|nr:peptidoglycan-binding protein [Methylomicrobium sp.]